MTKDQLTLNIHKYKHNEISGYEMADAVQAYTDALLKQCNVNCRLYEVKYYSSYAVWDKRIATYAANTEAEAIDKFWTNRNKENYEVMSVSLVNGN